MTEENDIADSAAEPAGPTHSGFVALIGPTNAGKSTLLNRLVGAKVSIVSHKVQTTRAVIRGIATHRNAQIVFMDTPGIFKPRRRLDRAMVTSAWGGAKDADVIMLLIDSERGICAAMPMLSSKVSRMCPSARSWPSTRSTASSARISWRWLLPPMRRSHSTRLSWSRPKTVPAVMM
jgi:tRNA U34 5-carboxymethylaminomethyl modifying GTPase MnmE/TrmE